MTRASAAVDTGAAIASGLAVALWLGGLVALGAVTAPIVFAVAPMPQSADAMTLVFRRFDTIAMTCAAVVLASEAARVVARVPFRRLDHARAAAGVLAAIVTTYEGDVRALRAMKAGACGYLLKNKLRKDLPFASQASGIP